MHVEIHVIAGPAKGQHFTFDKPDCFLFGRAEDAHISLPNDPYVSRQHFLLEISPPECTLKDLNSKNGVIVNGVRYGGQKPPTTPITQAPHGANEVRLKDGDEITVGDTHILVSIRPDPELQAAPGDRMKKLLKEAAAVEQARRAQQGSEKAHREPAADKTRFAPSPPSELPRIAGYQIVHKIRHRGTGTIYKAQELETGRDVAIKILLPQGEVDPYKVSLFHRELHIIRQLTHDHIVRFFGHGQLSGLFYFIFEFVEGIDVAKLIRAKGGRVPLAEAAPIMLGVLNGLAYAHQAPITGQAGTATGTTFHGIVHRNLKPQNILLEQRGKQWFPKITDFGLSKSFETAGLTDITTPGDVFGTPIYWPREQITHYRYLNPATDVFSIAAVFYEMLTGDWVRDGFQELSQKCKHQKRLPTISDYMSVIAAHPPIPIRDRYPVIPEPLAKVLDRALQEREIPHEATNMQERLATLRYPDAGAFRDALFTALNEIGLSQTPSETPEDLQAAPVSTEAIMYSISQPAGRRTVALLILDLVESTQYILNKGDTNFSTLMGSLLRRVRAHPSASELIFLKSTGDGFLSVFRSIPAAFSLAETFLEQPVSSDARIRMALHWGEVMTGPNGDVLGTEVQRVHQIEKVTLQHRIDPATRQRAFPRTNRLLITEQGLEQLEESAKARFRPGGQFQLKGFRETCTLWVLHT
jgi:serine/threonine protein kinase